MVDSSCYTEASGKFVFTGLKDGDVVYCKMTNAKFPDLTLQTTSVTVLTTNPHTHGAAHTADDQVLADHGGMTQHHLVVVRIPVPQVYKAFCNKELRKASFL